MIAKDRKLLEDVTLEAGFTQVNQMQEYFYGDRSTLVDSQGQKLLNFILVQRVKLR